MEKIIAFYDPNLENGWLANFSLHNIVLDGCSWQTVEHYFQAYKFLNINNKQFHAIKTASTPGQAKQIAKDNIEKRRLDWHSIRNIVMYRAIEAKFTQHDELKIKIINTIGYKIVENAPDDNYWGIGEGSGCNTMGVLLEMLRVQLIKGNSVEYGK